MENIQLHPTRTIVATNELIGKRFFIIKEQIYQKHLNSERNTGVFVIEKKNFKRHGDIKSYINYYIERHLILNDPALAEATNQFDFDVLTVCISEWTAGNRYLTYSTIYRALTGKVGESDANPSKVQLARIKTSMKKLMNTTVILNLTDACKHFRYNEGQPLKIQDKIVPARFVDCKVNGQKTTVIELTAESPFYKVAKAKNHQFVSYDAELLNVPNQNNTPLNITIKHYIMRRLIETQKHPRQMTPSITFADVYQKCRLETADNKKKQRVRELIKTFFEHLIDKGFLGSFQVNRKNGGFYSISFVFGEKNDREGKTNSDIPAPAKPKQIKRTEQIIYPNAFWTMEIMPSVHWQPNPPTMEIVPSSIDVNAIRYIFKTRNLFLY